MTATSGASFSDLARSKVVAEFDGRVAQRDYSEFEKDANAALTQLDKGLWRSESAKQCEAVIKFPGLIERFPFPILINAAFLRLADVFRAEETSNFVRLKIHEVICNTQAHLDKITNAASFVDKLFMVIYSNDYFARSLTLRVLAAVASIIPESKCHMVEHAIITSLDSNANIELQAAIDACRKLSLVSGKFAVTVFPKIRQMIEGLSCPVQTKYQLIPIFGNMFHDGETAVKTREVCTHFLRDYCSRAFVALILTTLTDLSLKHRLDVDQQVDLLLARLVSDRRYSVKLACLKNLKRLSSENSHQWTLSLVQRLWQAYNKLSGRTALKCLCLDVVASLISSVSSVDRSSVSRYFSDLLQDVHSVTDLHLRVKLVSVVALLLTFVPSCKEWDWSSVKLIALQNLSELSKVPVHKTSRLLKETLKTLVAVTQAKPALSVEVLQAAVISLQGSYFRSVSCRLDIFECMSAIGSVEPNSLATIFSHHLVELTSYAISDQKLLLQLFTAMFQACQGCEGIPWEWLETLGGALPDDMDAWTGFCMARQACRYGHFSIASRTFRELNTKVSREDFMFWLQGMIHCCTAEELLRTSSQSAVSVFREDLQLAGNHYRECLVQLKATGLDTEFQVKFLSLRLRVLEFCYQILRIASVRCILTSIDNDKPDAETIEVLEYMEKIGGDYAKLYQSMFNADSVSLQLLQLLRKSCESLVVLARLALTHKKESTPIVSRLGGFHESPSPTIHMEHQAYSKFISTCFRLTAERKSAKSSDIPSFSSVHLCRLLRSFLQIPFCLPRAFFQTLQRMQIKLVTQPQPTRGTSNIEYCVTAPSDADFVLNVQGIIINTSIGLRRELVRTVDQVHLTAHRVPSGDKVATENPLKARKSSMAASADGNVTHTLTPQHGYFSTQFLFSLPHLGLHTVQISTSVTDGNGDFWTTGPNIGLSVRVQEETAKQTIAQLAQNVTSAQQQTQGAQQTGGFSSAHVRHQHHRHRHGERHPHRHGDRSLRTDR